MNPSFSGRPRSFDIITALVFHTHDTCTHSVHLMCLLPVTHTNKCCLQQFMFKIIAYYELQEWAFVLAIGLKVTLNS